MHVELLRYWQHTLGLSPSWMATIGRFSKRTIDRWLYEKKPAHHELWTQLYTGVRYRHGWCLAKVRTNNPESNRYGWFRPAEAILPIAWNVTLFWPEGSPRWCLVYEWRGEIWDLEFDSVPPAIDPDVLYERLADHAIQAVHVYNKEVSSVDALTGFSP